MNGDIFWDSLFKSSFPHNPLFSKVSNLDTVLWILLSSAHHWKLLCRWKAEVTWPLYLLKGIFIFHRNYPFESYVIEFSPGRGLHTWIEIAKFESVYLLNLKRGSLTTLCQYNWTLGSLAETGTSPFVYPFFQRIYWR